MAKWEIDVSLAWNSPSRLEPVEHKNEWKYETTVSYIYDDERIYSNMTFFYNKDGKKIRTKYHVQEYKEQTKYFVKMDKEIQETIQNNSKLIQFLQQLIKNQNSIAGFKAFSYDFEEKQGEFTFEGCPLDFFFVFQPSVGIKWIYISYYPEYSLCNTRIKDDPKEVLGEEFTEMLNGWIKEKLKARFFF
jgi:hypothetical protein